MEEVNVQLEEAIQKKIEYLNSLPSNSQEYEKILKELEKLCEIRGNDMKLLADIEDARHRRQTDDEREVAESALKKDQLKEQKIERRIRSIFNTAGLLSALWLACVGFMFEENGSFHSDIFKWIRSGFKFTKY